MNLERHIEAHRNLYMHLVKGDGDSAQKHREFYDEYLAVMDLCADYYLQTVDTVFVRHYPLPKQMKPIARRRINQRAEGIQCARCYSGQWRATSRASDQPEATLSAIAPDRRSGRVGKRASMVWCVQWIGAFVRDRPIN